MKAEAFSEFQGAFGGSAAICKTEIECLSGMLLSDRLLL